MDDQFLDENGDLELKTSSKAWSSEEWEVYLETLEAPLKEELVAPKKYSRICESITQNEENL